jgi:starvation-inducible DNA-binding protein
MEELIDRLNRFLASSYVLYLKTHFYHWNVFGADFPQYHEFFGNVYEEVYGSIDTIAEHIRQINGIPENAPSLLLKNSIISESRNTKYVNEIVTELLDDVDAIARDIVDINKISERFSEIGLSNYLQDRHAAFKKHSWMLKSILKQR